MSEDINKRAIEWFVRLRSADATSADRHAHNDWLSRDEANRAAYDRVCREWVALDDLDDWSRGELAQLNLVDGARTRRRQHIASVGLATAAAIIVGIMVLPFLANQSDRYATQKAEQRQLTLEDGSRLHLNSVTELEVRYKSEVREITLLRGESIFDVEGDSTRPFMVHAGRYSVIALGTRFSVEFVGKSDVQVTVLEGQVAVVPEQEPINSRYRNVNASSVRDLLVTESRSVILEKDQQVTASESGEIETVASVSASNETSWSEGKLIFRATPLREVIAEMSNYVPGDIAVAEDVPDHPVTGIILIQNTEDMLDFLSEVAPITPVRQSASLTIVHAAPVLPSSG